MRLQAAVRMHIVRSLYMRQQQAAVLLQSAFRRVSLRTRFLQVGNESPHNARSLKSVSKEPFHRMLLLLS